MLNARLTMLAFVALLPHTSQADGPHDDLVYSRYSRTLQPTAFKVRYGKQRIQLDHPATKEDVDAGKAIFSFEGLGTSRVWKLEPYPIRHRDTHKRSSISATIWQAEELEVGGVWKRYYGVLCGDGAVVVPAEEWDAWWPDAPWVPYQDRAFDPQMAPFQPFGGPEYWAITLSRSGEKPRPRQSDDPLVMTVHFFNTTLSPIQLPVTWTKSVREGGLALLDAVSLSLRWIPFDPDYPLLRDPTELDPICTTRLNHDGAIRSVEPGKTCELFRFNLHDWYNIENEGYYSLRLTIDGKTLGTEDESQRVCTREFTIGKPPVLPSIEEYNKRLPVLGGPDNEARLRRLIKETVKPTPIDRQPLPPDVEQLLRWSEPVNGLAARIEDIAYDTIVIRLKNTSQQPLVVPTGNPRDDTAPQPFEICTRLSTEPWRSARAKPDMTPYCERSSPDEDVNRAYLTRGIRGEETDRPWVTLQPGEHCLAIVEILCEEDTEFKVVLRCPETSKEHWCGTLEAPVCRRSQIYEEPLLFRGRLPMPEDFPTLNYYGYSPSGTEPAVEGLFYGNGYLIRLLSFYDPTHVRKEFERRMTSETRMPMKLLLAAVAAQAGSEKGALYLLETAKMTDFRTIVNLHGVLASLVHLQVSEVPDWLVELSTTVLADQRFLTGLAGTDWEGRYFTIRSDYFETSLLWALADTNREAVLPILLDWARTGDWGAVGVLEEMADERSVSLLIELAERGHVGAIRSLGRIGNDRATAVLIKLSKNSRRREEAALALSQSDAKHTVPILVQMLEEVEPGAMESQHRDALRRLAEVDPKRASVLVAELLEKVDASQLTTYRGEVCAPLSDLAELAGKLKAKEAVPILLKYVQYPQVIEALGQIGDPAALPELQKIVKADGRTITKAEELSPEVAGKRLFAARIALCTWDSDGGVGRLLEMLDDSSLDEWQRGRVVGELADCRDPRTIPALLGVIQVGEGYSALEAARLGLAKLKYKAAVEGLIECFDVDFKDERFGKGGYVTPAIYRNRIARTLQEMTGQPFGADKHQWRKWWQEEGRHGTELR